MDPRTTFSRGDIVRFKSPTITKLPIRGGFNHHVNGRINLPIYKVDGVMGHHPFAPVLFNKRFFCASPPKRTRDGLMLYLYDNYKPNILGAGYHIHVGRPEMATVVGKVYDIRRLPHGAQKAITDDIYQNMPLRPQNFSFRNMSAVDELKYINKNTILLHYDDLGHKYAMLMIANYSCDHCGRSLCSGGTKVIHYDRLNNRTIISEINKRVGAVVDTLFPAAYSCGHCNNFIALASFKHSDDELFFEPVFLGRNENYTND